jgi:hypothetical protein
MQRVFHHLARAWRQQERQQQGQKLERTGHGRSGCKLPALPLCCNRVAVRRPLQTSLWAVTVSSNVRRRLIWRALARADH